MVKKRFFLLLLLLLLFKFIFINCNDLIYYDVCVCVCARAPTCVVVYNARRRIIYVYIFFFYRKRWKSLQKDPSNAPTIKRKKNHNYAHYRCMYFFIIEGDLSKFLVLSPPRVIIARPSRATYIIIKI